MTVAEMLVSHRRVALDANLFIYMFEAGGPEAIMVGALLDAAESAGAEIVVASLALAEVAVRPAGMSDEVMADRYADAIRSIRRLYVVPLTADIAIDAGILRGRTGLSLADAIHLVTARQAGATVFVTNDRRLRSTPKLEVVQLADLVA
jgi:predicted nucleic acid-binding protein